MDVNKYFEKRLAPMTVGSLIKAYRTLNDMTQKELAAKLKLKVSYISDLENGRKKLSLEKALQIAKKLGEFLELYAKTWTEESYRDAGLDFEKVINFKPIKESAIKPSVPRVINFSLPDNFKAPQHSHKRALTRKTSTRKQVQLKKAH